MGIHGSGLPGSMRVSFNEEGRGASLCVPLCFGLSTKRVNKKTIIGEVRKKGVRYSNRKEDAIRFGVSTMRHTRYARGSDNFYP